MGGLFDNLGKRLENKEDEGGISALDLASLSPPLRKIMRLMLREVEMSYPALCEAAAELPGGMSQEELDQALDELHKQSWLIKMGQGSVINYKVNLRRKRGSQLTGGIWDALDHRIKKSDSEETEESGE